MKKALILTLGILVLCANAFAQQTTNTDPNAAGFYKVSGRQPL